MNPKAFLAQAEKKLAAMEAMKKRELVVGLPKGQATAKIYENGVTVLDIGVWHEFGNARVPERSWMRVPLRLKRNEINEIIESRFERAMAGQLDPDKVLGLAGTKAVDVMRNAFTSKGYGTWPDIQDSTKAAKGSSQPLVDTGTLRQSITYEVRNAS